MYIGLIIFPHIDKKQSASKNYLKGKRSIKKETQKHRKVGHPLSWPAIGDGNSTSVYNSFNI